MGALQVQLTNSFFYMSLYTTVALTFTFWYTAGYQIAERYAPWLSFWMFVGICFLGLMVLMYLDYRFMYPIRAKFINEQTCKHENPAMDSLRKLEADISQIKKELGLE